MASVEYRIYLDNSPASADQLARFTEIRVDQGIGVATEAELDLQITTDDAGLWSGVEEDFAQAFARVRIEVKVADADFVALIDGPVVGNRYEMKANPDESHMTVVVQDDSVLLNRDEQVVLFTDQAPQDIVSSRFEEVGLTADVDSVPDAGAALERAFVQRGTSMQFIRELGKRYGMFVYVLPGDSPGVSVGSFKRPQFAPSTLPEILLLSDKRNVASFSAEFDALRPIKAHAGSVALADKSVLTSVAEEPDIDPLGDSGAHDVTQPAVSMLTGTREEQTDLDAATAATVDLSSWAYSANGELGADNYEGVLQPHQTVTVRGIGGFLSGVYLISRVTHVLNDQAYRQRFSLHRNARSAGVSSGLSIPAGVF